MATEVLDSPLEEEEEPEAALVDDDEKTVTVAVAWPAEPAGVAVLVAPAASTRRGKTWLV